MRYGVAVAGDRVAPRCVFAEFVLVVVLRGNRARAEERKTLESEMAAALGRSVVAMPYRCSDLRRDQQPGT